MVELDVEVTDDLRAEGMARDVVRAIQQARKDADLVVTDRIEVVLGDGGGLAEPVEAHRDWIMEQVLATSMDVEPAERRDGEPGWSTTEKVPFRVAIQRVG